MIDPLTIGLVTGGIQAIGAIGGFFGQQDKARAENKARIKQYKQAMRIRDQRDSQRFTLYNAKSKITYKQNLGILDKRFGMEQMQEDLRMNELLKGSKLASQNRLVNEVEALGKVGTTGMSGVSMGKRKQSAMAKLGREAQVRRDQMTSSIYAKQMRDDARVASLDAARMKEFNKVRFAPAKSPVQEMGAMVQGPSPMSLIAGIGNAALGGISAGVGQFNTNQSILAGNV